MFQRVTRKAHTARRKSGRVYTVRAHSFMVGRRPPRILSVPLAPADRQRLCRYIASRIERAREAWIKEMTAPQMNAARLAAAAVALADADPRHEERILTDTWDAHERVLSRRRKLT